MSIKLLGNMWLIWYHALSAKIMCNDNETGTGSTVRSSIFDILQSNYIPDSQASAIMQN